MPVYEFLCLDCQKPFEVLCSIRTDPATVVCTRCQGNHVKKLISSVARTGSRDPLGIEDDAGGSSCSSCSTGNCGSCGH